MQVWFHFCFDGQKYFVEHQLTTAHEIQYTDRKI